MENLSTFVRTLGNQFIRGRKIFTGIVGLEGTVLDGNTSAGTSGQVLSTTGSGVQWITVGSSNVGELDDLTDVQVGTPSNGQLLRYDSESGLWYNWTPNYLDTTDGLNDLNGVVITSAVSNQFLKYNGTNWVNANVLLSDLGDTSISSPSADQILVYGQPLGGTPGVNVWYNKTHSFLTTSTNIDDLNNVIISTQTAGDILRYNGTNWVNVPFSNLENDTLDSVTDRGNTTTNTINVGGVITDYVEFDTSVTLGGDESQGYMAWNSDVDTVSVYPYDSTWFNIGQDMHWHVKNGTAHTIERGQVVMATGAVGNSGKIEAGLMVADGTVSSKYILGIAIRDIASGEFGKVASQGIIRGVDTSSYQDGTLLWADPDTDGGLTSTEPDAPNLRLPIAFVVSAATNGAIAVRITTGNVLHELHDVDAPSPATGDLLRYSALTGIWENWTPTYISSFTEADPIFVASPAHGIASTDINNWNTAYGWGDHSTAGYLTALPNHNHDDRYYTETEVNTLLAGKAAVSHTHEIEDITGLSDSLDLKLETESDTLDSVTGRGNTTSNTIFVGSARGSSGTYGTGIYGDNSGASVQFGTSAAVDSLGIIGAYSSQFNINSKNGPLSFQYYGTEYMNISAAGALKLNSYGAGLLKTDANGNVTVDTNVYITADDQELTWEQSTKELSISDGNTVTLSGLASIADVEGYGYITTEVDTLNTVTSRGATTTNNISVGQAFSVGSNVGTTETYVQIGNGRTDSGYAYIDFVGDTTYTDYGLRIIRGNGGANTGSTITHRGTGSLTLQTSDSASIAFNTNAAERMRITSAGNVGIGTTSPQSPLSVKSNSTSSATSGFTLIANGSTDIIAAIGEKSTNGGRFHLYDGGAPKVAFYSDGTDNYIAQGNLGIGTTSPSALLHIAANNDGTSNNIVLRFEDTDANTSANQPLGQIQFYGNDLSNAGAGVKVGIKAFSLDNAGNSYLTFSTSDTTSNDQERLRIDKDGNVGIGTTSPSAKLDIHTATNSNGLFIREDTDDSITHNLWIDSNDHAQFYMYQNGQVNTVSISSSGNSYFNGGNVGIGTTSPVTKLYVQETAATPTLLTLHNYQSDITPGSGNFIEFVMTDANTTATPQAKIGMIVGTEGGSDEGITTEGDGNFVIMTMDATDGAGNGTLAERVRVTHTGKVGIGTASPSQKLHVVGRIMAEGTGYTLNPTSPIFGQYTSTRGYVQVPSNGQLEIWTGGTAEIATFYENRNSVFHGNVGIGTTSPSAPLHVSGISTWSNGIIAQGNANDGVGIGIKNDAGKNWFLISTGSNNGGGANNLGIYEQSGDYRLYIKSGGNVGIGTTSPSYKLHVNGSFSCTTMNISEDITTSAGNVVLANDAGIYSLKTGTITAGNSSTAFRVSNTDDVQAARVTFVVESTNFQVAKIYEVVKAGNNDPVAFKVVDTGPSGEEDFSVAFSNDGGDLLCTVTNDSSAESMVVVSTIFLGGSISSQTVSAS